MTPLLRENPEEVPMNPPLMPFNETPPAKGFTYTGEGPLGKITTEVFAGMPLVNTIWVGC